MKKITELRERRTVRITEREGGKIVEKEKSGMALREVNVVSHGPRFAHYIIDMVCIYGVTGLLIFAADSLNLDDHMTFIVYLIMPFFYTLFEYAFQQTPGKMATGCYVIDEYGEKPKPLSLLGRNLARLVPFEALSCLGKRGWHDTWSKTFVVPKKEYDELKRLLGESNDPQLQGQEEDEFF